MPDSFYFSISLKVRFADCDMMGHVNHAKILTYMEEARVTYLRFIGLEFENAEQLPYSGILAEIQCSYRSPAFLDEVLEIKIRTAILKRSSFVLEYAITEKTSARLVATGKTVIVLYDYKIKTSTAIPQELREKIEAIEQRVIETV